MADREGTAQSFRNKLRERIRTTMRDYSQRAFISRGNQNTTHCPKTSMNQRTTQARLPSIPRKECKSKYMDFPMTTLRLLPDSHTKHPVRNFRKKKKMNRLLAKMDYISFLTECVDQTFYKTGLSRQTVQRPFTKSSTLQQSQCTKNIRRRKKGDYTSNPPEYTDATLEKLVNNDTSYCSDTSFKKELILKSMKGTFLCSNYLRFQPLLNVFD